MDLKVYRDRPFAPTHGAAAVVWTAHTLSKVYAAAAARVLHLLPLHVSIGGYIVVLFERTALYITAHIILLWNHLSEL